MADPKGNTPRPPASAHKITPMWPLSPALLKRMRALPADDLCLRAARLLQRESACSAGVDICIDKQVPWGAGLGGGAGAALCGGEDYELAFTVPPRQVATLLAEFKLQFHLPVTVIGAVTEGPARVTVDGLPCHHTGYNHFQTAK